jgi:hypothetical protein
MLGAMLETFKPVVPSGAQSLPWRPQPLARRYIWPRTENHVSLCHMHAADALCSNLHAFRTLRA